MRTETTTTGATNTDKAAAAAARKAAKATSAKAKKTAAPKAPKEPKAAPVATTSNRGAVKQQILAAATSAYAKLPADADHKAVLAMRVTVMDALVVQGVKRTTASCMLGEWQKTLPKHQQLPARK